MSKSPYSLIIIGSGISGLCIALRALDLGYDVRIVSKDEARLTASGMAAGMIAPALEAINDPRPVEAYARFKNVQKYWIDFAQNLGLIDIIGMAKPSLFVWRPLKDHSVNADIMLTRFMDMGVKARPLSDMELAKLGYGSDFSAIEVCGDWLIEARGLIGYLQSAFTARGGQIISDSVLELLPHQAILKSGSVLEATHIVLAAGYGSKGFADLAPSLNCLKPIKGHVLDIDIARDNVLAGRAVRTPDGYFVVYGEYAKFGATMQMDQDDLAVEPDIVVQLSEKAQDLSPDGLKFEQLLDVTPHTGVRASTPDGLPLIGQDLGSNLWLATGMRRNGWLYGPYAGEVIMALINGSEPPFDAATYDPNRFV